MRATDIIIESKTAPLYHFTSFKNLVSILNSNTLQARGNRIYFTRDYLRQFIPHEHELLDQPYGLRIDQELLSRDYGRQLHAGGQPTKWDEKKRQAWIADPRNAREIETIKSTGKGTGMRYDKADPRDIIRGTVTQARRWESEEHLDVLQLPNLNRYLTGIVLGLSSGSPPEIREIDPDPLTEIADLLITIIDSKPKGFDKRNWLLDSATKLRIPIIYKRREFEPQKVKKRIIQLYSQRKREREAEVIKPQQNFIIFTNKAGGGLATGGSNIDIVIKKLVQDPRYRDREIYGYSKGYAQDAEKVWFDKPTKVIDLYRRMMQS